jgi:hypothetical protein
MAKQKPGDEQHRPGDEPENLFPTDETAAETVELVDDDAWTSPPATRFPE